MFLGFGCSSCVRTCLLPSWITDFGPPSSLSPQSPPRDFHPCSVIVCWRQPQGAFCKNLVSPGEDSQGTNNITIQSSLGKYHFWGMLFPSLALGILCRLEAMVDNLWATKNHYLNKELDVWHFKVHGHCHHGKNQNCVGFPLILPFITALIVNYIL